MSRGRNGLRYAIESGAVRHHKADVERMVLDGDGVALTLTTGALIASIGVPPHLLQQEATWRWARRGWWKAAWLCSCGYPAPAKYLKWGDVYVAGALAESSSPGRRRGCWGASGGDDRRGRC